MEPALILFGGLSIVSTIGVVVMLFLMWREKHLTKDSSKQTDQN